jgi:CheY-like chemotaxis protein
LKNDPDLAAIPVVMVSMTDDRSLGYALGATEFMTKPVDRARLATLLERFRSEAAQARALVVDDDQSTRELFVEMLGQEGWEATEAENGRVALACIAAAQPSLILLDLAMPEMDGFELVEALQANAEWRTIPVVVVTGHDLDAAERARLEGCVRAVMQKGGFNRDELLAQIRDMVVSRVHRS